MILFHGPDDTESIKNYKAIVESQLLSEKRKKTSFISFVVKIQSKNLIVFVINFFETENINFLTADGKRFAHPLHHLGKAQSDLPLIAIDSFRHMYLFPKFQDMYTPGKLKAFVDDLHSGKLHREFHYGPEKTDETSEHQPQADKPTQPPESTFKKLAPSKNRYTLLRDEL